MRALVLAAACVMTSAAQAVPSFIEVKAAYRPSDLSIVARDGTTIQTLRIDKSVRRLPWLPLDEISPALLTAIVLSEDKRFYEHSGVDWGAVARSAWANAWNTRTRGASTLTMQLAGLLDAGLARPSGGRSVSQKLGQALTATRLDAQWKKSEVLEAYLNLVAWRGEVVGVNAEDGLHRTRLAYGQCALEQGSYDLCLQTLDRRFENEAALHTLATEKKAGLVQRERESETHDSLHVETWMLTPQNTETQNAKAQNHGTHLVGRRDPALRR